MSNPYQFSFAESTVQRRQRRRDSRHGNISWQLWIVVAFLGLEAVGNLLAVPAMPVAAIWLATKILLITGLICRWRLVFVLHVVLGLLHVFAFTMQAPFVALVNLLLVGLVVSQFRRFFPSGSTMNQGS